LTWNEHIVVAYDVMDDRAREAFASKLMDLGLQRVQLSVFEATLPKNRVRDVWDLSEEFCREAGRSVKVFVVCSTCHRRVRSFGETGKVDDTEYRIV